jgi:transposase InsO family protein
MRVGATRCRMNCQTCTRSDKVWECRGVAARFELAEKESIPRHALRSTQLLWLKGWCLIRRLQAFNANEATNLARAQVELT